MISVNRIFLAFLFFLSVGCGLPIPGFSSTEKADTIPVLAALALANQSGGSTPTTSVGETRPFRTRTFSLLQDGGIHCYDWNQDQEIYPSPTSIVLPTGITDIYPSDNGRYSYAKSATGFYILDSGLNLSPHEGHFHYERSTQYTILAHSKINLAPPSGTVPGSVYSKNGWVAFFFKGTNGNPSQVRLLRESEIAGPTPLLISGPSGLPSNLDGIAVPITDKLMLVSSSGTTTPTEFKLYHTTNLTANPTWNDTAPPNSSQAITISCPNFQSIAHTQIPSAQADFSQLESGYQKIHFLSVSCGGASPILQTIRHDDSATSNQTRLQSATPPVAWAKLHPTVQNTNIERGARTVRAILLATPTPDSGSGTVNEFYRIDWESLANARIETSAFRPEFLGSEKRLGAEAYILTSDGNFEVYDLTQTTAPRKRVFSSTLTTQELGNAKFYTTWNAGFVVFANRIQEYNLEENYRARVRVHTQNLLDQRVSIQGFFGMGANYEGSH